MEILKKSSTFRDETLLSRLLALLGDAGILLLAFKALVKSFKPLPWCCSGYKRLALSFLVQQGGRIRACKTSTGRLLRNFYGAECASWIQARTTAIAKPTSILQSEQHASSIL